MSAMAMGAMSASNSAFSLHSNRSSVQLQSAPSSMSRNNSKPAALRDDPFEALDADPLPASPEDKRKAKANFEDMSVVSSIMAANEAHIHTMDMSSYGQAQPQSHQPTDTFATAV